MMNGTLTARATNCGSLSCVENFDTVCEPLEFSKVTVCTDLSLQSMYSIMCVFRH